MRLTRLSAAMAVAALVAAPALAAPPNPAGSLALANGKGGDDGSAAPHKSHTGTIVIAGLALAAVIGGAVALGSGDHHRGSMPASN